MALPYRVPGVYYEPRPRAPEEPAVRTDIVGFIGFEPRVRNGTTASTLKWAPAFPPPAPPVGYSFQVDVAGFQLVLNAVPGRVPQTKDFDLDHGTLPTPIPILDKQRIVYALAAAGKGHDLTLVVAKGTATDTVDALSPPSDADVAAAVTAKLGPGTWPQQRIADVEVRRELDAVWVVVHPSLSITRCDDFRDYVLAFGPPEDDGTLLGPSVRAFFANGGRRCWVATLRRPHFEDKVELPLVLGDLVGIPGSSELEATGLERLLLLPQVTVVDAPDLYARRVDRDQETVQLPSREEEACFLPCPDVLGPAGAATTNSRVPAWKTIFASTPLFDALGATNDVFETQKNLLLRCVQERWRVLLLLSVPLMPDGGSGPHVPPTEVDAKDWVNQFDLLVKKTGFAETDELSSAALYWPWVLYQEEVDAPVLEMPPSPYAAGVIARRDTSRGPQISPANETLKQVVGLTSSFGDDVHGRLYSPDPDTGGLDVPSVNVFRAFPGYGVQVWGARTLSTEMWLRFVSVRRTLTAIELRMKAALDLLVFEPNTPMLWLQITHVAFSVLMPIFESGALRGDRPEEAFYVRCDNTVNTPESIARGELYVEVGVAVAAPAEFIVFRVGRREGVVEVLE
jgi:uncharacterized protein